MRDEYKEGYLRCAEYIAMQVATGAEQLRNKVKIEQEHAEILFRCFEPISCNGMSVPWGFCQDRILSRHFGPIDTIVRCPDCEGDGYRFFVEIGSDDTWVEDCELCEGQGVMFWAEIVAKIGYEEAKELAEMTRTYSRFKEQFERLSCT